MNKLLQKVIAAALASSMLIMALFHLLDYSQRCAGGHPFSLYWYGQ